jgi:hypothetical protein
MNGLFIKRLTFIGLQYPLFQAKKRLIKNLLTALVTTYPGWLSRVGKSALFKTKNNPTHAKKAPYAPYEKIAFLRKNTYFRANHAPAFLQVAVMLSLTLG